MINDPPKSWSKVHKKSTQLGISPREMFITALKECNGNVTDTANLLGLSRQGVYDWIKNLNIRREYEIKIVEN